MAIDFSQVKTITIPEGSVKQITDSQGNILWKKAVPQWHTLWEGSREVNVSTWSNNTNVYVTGSGNVCQGDVSKTPQFRITFTHTYQSNTSYFRNRKYYWGGSSQTAKTSIGTSPKTITVSGWGTDILYLTGDKKGGYSAGSGQLRLAIKTDATTGNISLWGGYADITKGHDSVSCYLTLTVTKIEQYY